MPIARVGFAEVVVVEGTYTDVFILKKKSVLYLMIDSADAATLSMGVCDQLDCGELFKVGNENIVRVTVDVLGLFDPRDLVDGENEVGKSADVVDVHVRDENRADTLNVDSRRICRVRAVLARVEPIIFAVYLKNERAMVATRLGLGARAGADEIYFDHFLYFFAKYSAT